MKKGTAKKFMTRRGFFPVKKTVEEIICPECYKRQTAIVEHTLPWATYIKRCRRCGYVIMESEWNQAPEIKPHEQIRKRFFAITNGKHWYQVYEDDYYPTYPTWFYNHNHSDFDKEDYRQYYWYFIKGKSKRRKGMVKFFSHKWGRKRRQINRERMDDLPF